MGGPIKHGEPGFLSPYFKSALKLKISSMRLQTLHAAGSTVPRASNRQPDHFLGGSFLSATNEDSQLWKVRKELKNVFHRSGSCQTKSFVVHRSSKNSIWLAKCQGTVRKLDLSNYCEPCLSNNPDLWTLSEASVLTADVKHLNRL